ncbi:MAG: hypothetical protein COS57_07240 [Syntrophobacterales bacterium CG03_land_8_20_14_0_80_58_14]|nr:MAG: hypothetical protein COS57_07240 [Syntrophobacterales bacterium CG03_land_8_20_14_0_80_58_14]
MDPRDFLDLAKKLSGGSTAAEYRTAISRAYYATYHVGAAFLKDIGCPISAGPQAHGEVRNDLSNCGDAELAGVGSQLADLHKKRIIADYRLTDVKYDNQKTSQAVTVQAGRMIQALDRCGSGSRRDEIARAVNKYLRILGYPFD